jgi:hypothetical protein
LSIRSVALARYSSPSARESGIAIPPATRSSVSTKVAGLLPIACRSRGAPRVVSGSFWVVTVAAISLRVVQSSHRLGVPPAAGWICPAGI